MYLCVNMCARVHVCKCVYFVYMYVYVFIYVFMFVCTHVCMYACIHCVKFRQPILAGNAACVGKIFECFCKSWLC